MNRIRVVGHQSSFLFYFHFYFLILHTFKDNRINNRRITSSIFTTTALELTRVRVIFYLNHNF